jgi:phosphinothricin acetyltransferase
MSDITIKIADVSDASELLKIYKYYVENTAITFDYTVPGLEEFKNKIRETLKQYPYIVAVAEGEIIGYAYASVFKARPAYDWAVETTIYIKNGFTKSGCGGRLYREMEELLKKQNILNVNACIAFTDTPDEHLTDNSPKFHRHIGYRLVGKFNRCGYKFNKWYDMVWMEKFIGEHSVPPKAVIPFAQLVEGGAVSSPI